MKYIRTKDDVFELKSDKEQIINGTHYYITNDMYERDYQYKEEDVVKFADTIEELCDEFVLIHTEYDNSKDIFESHGGEAKHRGDSYYNFSFEQIRTGRRIIKGTIYGAIWTDEGLIYKAKMDVKKVEFELL